MKPSAQVFSVLSRSDIEASSPSPTVLVSRLDVYRTSTYDVFPARRRVVQNGRDVDLGARAFDLLITLVESRDRVLSKRELMAKAWPGMVVEENALHVQVSQLRKKLGRHVIATVTGQGYRFVDELLSPQADGPGFGSAADGSGSVPVPATRLIGRQAELAICLKLLQDKAQLSLTGMGGCGKTRLAVAIAHELSATGLAAWFVDLSGVSEGIGVLPAIVEATGARERADEPLVNTLVAHLRPKQGILVLDNCEHLVSEVARVVRALSALPTLQVLATSRQPLHLHGEQLFALTALALPTSTAAEDVMASEAVQLFIDRARLLNAGFAVAAEEVGHVARICERLDGIPLAIELAAARTKLLTIGQLDSRLSARFQLLVGGISGHARQQTLRASMQWSYELLDAEERRLFRELAVFAGGATLESVGAVCFDGDEQQALDGLTSLYDKSLVVFDAAGEGQPRYRMLNIVWEFAREALDATAGDPARTRHLLHFAALAAHLVPRAQLAFEGSTLSRLRREQDNFHAAFAWAANAPDGAAAALRLAGSLWPYWLTTAQLITGEAFSNRAIDLARPGDQSLVPLLGRVALGLGNLRFYRGRYAEARLCAADALAQARVADDRVTAGFALKLMAGACHALGDDVAALEHYRATLALAIENGDLVLHGAALNNIGEVHRGLGQLAEADVAYRAAIRVIENSDAKANLALVKANLSRLRVLMKEPRDAASSLLEAQTIAALTSNRYVLDEVIDIAAAVAGQLGNHHTAARFHGASAARRQESGGHQEPLDEAFVKVWLEGSEKALGGESFAFEAQQGRNLSVETALNEVELFLRQCASKLQGISHLPLEEESRRAGGSGSHTMLGRRSTK